MNSIYNIRNPSSAVMLISSHGQFTESSEVQMLEYQITKSHTLYETVIAHNNIEQSIQEAAQALGVKKIELLVFVSHGFIPTTSTNASQDYGLQLGEEFEDKSQEYIVCKISDTDFNLMSKNGVVIINACDGNILADAISKKYPYLTIAAPYGSVTYAALVENENNILAPIFLNGENGIVDTCFIQNGEEIRLSGIELAQKYFTNLEEANAAALVGRDSIWSEMPLGISTETQKLVREKGLQLLLKSNIPKDKALSYSIANIFNKGMKTQDKREILIKKNMRKAVTWYVKAAELGHKKSARILAELFLQEKAPEKPRRLKKDIRSAIKIFHLDAAKKGNCLAQLALGQFYLKKQKYSRAATWLLKAAKNGSKKAMDILEDLINLTWFVNNTIRKK